MDMPSSPLASLEASAQPAPSDEPPRFEQLPSFRLDVLQSLMTRQGELLCERLFGLRISECRVLGVVGHLQPATLKQTSVELGLDKGQTSRLVAGLEAAGLLVRREDPHDQRSFYLMLTEAGQSMRNQVARTAGERNCEWLGALSADEQHLFLRCMDRLSARARAMLESEHELAGTAPRLPLHLQESPRPPETRPLLVDPQALRDLRDRLSALLGDPAAVPGTPAQAPATAPWTAGPA